MQQSVLPKCILSYLQLAPDESTSAVLSVLWVKHQVSVTEHSTKLLPLLNSHCALRSMLHRLYCDYATQTAHSAVIPPGYCTVALDLFTLAHYWLTCPLGETPAQLYCLVPAQARRRSGSSKNRNPEAFPIPYSVPLRIVGPNCKQRQSACHTYWTYYYTSFCASSTLSSRNTPKFPNLMYTNLFFSQIMTGLYH